MNVAETVDQHYGFGGIFEKIRAALDAAGKDLENLSPDDLAPIDEFHTRGRESTEELTHLAEIDETKAVLDVGCGLGGTARYVAERFGCRVTGIDLTEEYIEVAKKLTELVGLGSKLTCEQGSALALPYEDASFDIVLTEHAQMNIEEKAKFYSEIGRVLRPGGRLVFHDIFRGEGPEPLYPVPWAEESAISFLAKENAVEEALRAASLKLERWDDKREESLLFFQRVLERVEEQGPPPLGIHLLMGNNAKEKVQNYIRNLTQDSVEVVMGVAIKG